MWVNIINEIILSGRISSELSSKYSSTGNDVTCILNFNIAVPDRKSKKDESGNYQTDFFKVVSFGSIAEAIEKYCYKGDHILIKGILKNNNYTNKEGQKIYGTEIHLSEVEFLETKKAE